MADSSVTSGVYDIQCAAPTFNPAAGIYAVPQSVTISTTTSGATIRYTTDGSTPSESAGTIYSGAVAISVNTTLKAIAYLSGMADSPVTSGVYHIRCAAPTFNPPAGTYPSAQSVTITTTTSGATIRYTTDGSTPSESSGTVYSGAVPISVNTTLKAIAYLSGMADSPVTSGVYDIQCAAPTFTPAAGTYTAVQSVTITSGATIRYTTDGSTPSATHGTVYSAPVSIGVTCTLQAIAYMPGMANSPVTSGVYTIHLPLTAVSFTANPPSPQRVDSVTVTLTASATGGTNITYQFWLYSQSALSWRELQGFSSSPRCTWIPTKPGNYLISVTAQDGLTGTEVSNTAWYGIIDAPLTAVYLQQQSSLAAASAHHGDLRCQHDRRDKRHLSVLAL